MITFILFTVQLITFLAVLFLCFHLLRKTSLSAALLVALAVNVFVPYLLSMGSFRLGFAIYESNPSLRYPSWDVGLAFCVWIAMILSYIIGFISLLAYGWRRFRNKVHSDT